MQREEWSIWKPIPDVVKSFRLEKITRELGTVKIFLYENSKAKTEQQIIFENSVVFYRVTEELCTLLRFYEVSVRYGQDFSNSNSFFKISNSEEVKRLKVNMADNEKDVVLYHYVIEVVDACIDVIATCEPKIE